MHKVVAVVLPWVLLLFAAPLFAAALFTGKQTAVLEAFASKWERDSVTLLVVPITPASEPITGECSVVARDEWIAVGKGLMRAAQDLRYLINRKPPTPIQVWPSTDERSTPLLFDYVRPDPMRCLEGQRWPCLWSSMQKPYSDPATTTAAGQ